MSHNLCCHYSCDFAAVGDNLCPNHLMERKNSPRHDETTRSDRNVMVNPNECKYVCRDRAKERTWYCNAHIQQMQFVITMEEAGVIRRGVDGLLRATTPD
jgi:hypothetical protein